MFCKFSVPKRAYGFGVATKLRIGRTGVRIPVGLGDLSHLVNIQSSSGVHPSSYSAGDGGFFLRGNGKAVDHLTASIAALEMSAATHLFFFYGFILFMGTTFLYRCS